MGIWGAYRLRWQRRRWLFRAWRQARSLRLVQDHTPAIRAGQILLFACLRNEITRLPWFLDYYRKLGVSQFLIVDNGSQDGSADWLRGQSDVSLWQTDASYRAANFGADWLNALLRRYGSGHWCLTVDPDEFLVYPFSDSRPLRALTDWLDASGTRALPAMLLDMYPKGPITAQPYTAGTDPLAIACWFDSGNYTLKRNPALRNLWIQGGPRARAFFAETPAQAPALNKIPLVRWQRGYCYTSSTHMLLPRGLNLTYDRSGGESISGCLLHTKFLDTLTAKVEEEALRGQHYAAGAEYQAYLAGLNRQPDLWCKWSEKFINWRQLEILGLMSKGNWT